MDRRVRSKWGLPPDRSNPSNECEAYNRQQQNFNESPTLNTSQIHSGWTDIPPGFDQNFAQSSNQQSAGQGMYAGRKRSWEEPENDDEDEIGADNGADSNSDMEDEELALAVQKAYQNLLPAVVEFVTGILGQNKPNILTDAVEKQCLVCRSSQRFKGWKALLAHAEKFKKKKLIQHRGFYQALSECLQSDPISKDEGKSRVVVGTEHLIVWPPVVILEKVEHRNQKPLLEKDEILVRFPDLRKPSIVHFFPADSAVSLVVFEDSTIGYLDAKTFEEWLAKQSCGREEWESWQRGMRLQGEERDETFSAVWHYGHESERGVSASSAGFDIIFGFMASPNDMRKFDPQNTVNWSEEILQEKVQYAHKKSKEKHEKEKAMLREKELELKRLQVSEERCITSKQHLSSLLEDKEKEIYIQKKRRDELESKHAEEKRRQEIGFQNDLKAFDAVSVAKERKLRENLESNERQLAEEQIMHLQEVKNVRQKIETKQEEVKDALHKEEEASRKIENYRDQMLKAEVKLMELMERQQEELLKLFEDNENEKHELLKKRIEDQEALQKEATAKQREEGPSAIFECVVCFEELKNNRALLKPCGHARLCLECALDLWKNKRPCPICRGLIASKPDVPPQNIYY